MAPIIDLREHFGIWEHCGNSKFWRGVPWRKARPDSYNLYVNPIDGVMISAMDHPQIGGPAYHVTVREAQAGSETAYRDANVMPWVRSVLNAFFGALVAFGVVEELQPSSLKHKTRLAWFVAHYKDQEPSYLETGEGHQETGKDEVLTATKAILGSMGKEVITLSKVILKDELSEVLERYGILEC